MSPIFDVLHVFVVVVFSFPLFLLAAPTLDITLLLPSDRARLRDDSGRSGTRWAVLVAGSSGFANYRHQADVCHAYQIMRKGGLKDDNIIVFMYDDIAYNKHNPRPGVIINHPQGENVYAGVPKDYVGDEVNVANFFAVLLGNKTALTGGSGKVVDSDPHDHIFIYYADHGGPGVLGMPTYPFLYANDLVNVLKQKHSAGTYKSMVIYLEACESGSIFDGLLPSDLNIYATTAANTFESSWSTYCPGEFSGVPSEYHTCLGDLYSVAWMEDSDVHNLQIETLELQYHVVNWRTSVYRTSHHGSHVMQYGDLNISQDSVFMYIGSNPANNNSTFAMDNPLLSSVKAVNQRDADLHYFWHKFQKSPEGSITKLDAQKELFDVMTHRMHVDSSIKFIEKILFGSARSKMLKIDRSLGQPLVDDWDCLKSMVRSFEASCGSLLQYGMKYMRTLANICNAGITKDTMTNAASQACIRVSAGTWNSLHRNFTV